MVKTNLLLAIRQLKNNKVFSLINIVGLSFSMVACLLIYKYVTFERSYDDYHENVEDIYRLYRHSESPNDFSAVASIFPAIAPNIKANIPEIEKATRFIGSAKIFQSFAFSYIPQTGSIKTFNIERGFFADGDALEILTLNWIDNDGSSSLKNPNELVISESFARRFFGEERAVGKVLQFKNMRQEYLVTGVFEDLPDNTHFKFDLLCSFGSLPQGWELDQDYGWGNFYTYLKLAPEADLEVVYDKINIFLEDKETWYSEEGITFRLQPIQDIHLKSNLTFELEANGNERTVNFLSIIGVFIMVIAWVNYINLSTSKLVDRAREVGVRKVLGGYKRQLIGQFLTESLTVNLIAIILTFTLLQLSIGFFQGLLGIPLAYFSGGALQTTLIFILAFSAGSFLFGLYPALLFSRLKITQVLTGRSKSTKSGLVLRKGLTVFQFVVALILIIGTVSVFQQLNYLQNQSLGMDIEQTLVIKKPFMDSANRAGSHDSFLNQVNQISGVNGITASSEVPGNVITRMRAVSLGPEDNSHYLYAKDIDIDESFLDIYDVELLYGTSFDGSNQTNCFMLNLSAAEYLFGTDDLASKINQTYYYLDRPQRLIGIMADYNQESLKVSSEPHIYSSFGRTRFFSIKLQGDNIGQKITEIEAAFDTSFPASHFDYFFMDEYFNRQYQNDRLFGEIFTFFSVLAVVITGLGLFGLSLYNISQRSKEVSIRKVLGASVSNISILLSREYVWLLALASLMGMPVGYFMVDQWLSNFASRMPIHLLLFITPILIILMITFLSVGYQVVKAAFSNPADSLRYE